MNNLSNAKKSKSRKRENNDSSPVNDDKNSFFQWTKANDTISIYNLRDTYNLINTLLLKSKIIKRSIIETRDPNVIQYAINNAKKIFGNKSARKDAVKLLSAYLKYIEETSENNKNTGVLRETDSLQEKNNHTLQAEVEGLLLESDLEGMTLKEIADRIPNVSMSSVKSIRDYSSKIIELNDHLLHVDALVDLNDGAKEMHAIIEKLMQKNNGYVSAMQLFEYIRVEIPMFLNDNNITKPQELYCIAKYLFGKTDWHGYHYEFSSGRHISRIGTEVLKNNVDIIINFAREQDGVFKWNDLLDYLDKVGIKPNNLRGQMSIGTKPIFFYCSSDDLITCECMQIDDEWLAQVKNSLEKLFLDVGDHVVIRSIVSFWYDLLPVLPKRVKWTPILLQYVLKFYGDELGARTIHPEITQQYDSIHSYLVRKDCELQTFGDAVIAYVIDSGIKERHFHSEQLRRVLIRGGLIGELELVGNVPHSIGNDPRFAWDAAEECVTLRI